MSTAITRALSPLLINCELTHIDRSPIDFEKAEDQHTEYENALRKMGYTIRRLAETPHLADGVFVEDTAVVFPEVGIITRPGAESRRPETESMADVLKEYRELKFIQEPATIDGGDVLVIGKKVWIGNSTRTNKEAIRQSGEFLKPFGYEVIGVPVTECLHLKTAIAMIEDDLLFINPKWVSPDIFTDFHCEFTHPDEPRGANIIRRGNWVLCPSAFPHTLQWLSGKGYDVISIDQSELAKAEAGLTCCSVIVE